MSRPSTWELPLLKPTIKGKYKPGLSRFPNMYSSVGTRPADYPTRSRPSHSGHILTRTRPMLNPPGNSGGGDGFVLKNHVSKHVSRRQAGAIESLFRQFRALLRQEWEGYDARRVEVRV